MTKNIRPTKQIKKKTLKEKRGMHSEFSKKRGIHPKLSQKEQFRKYLERIEDPKYDGADAS
jgi:hypothetical protein